MVFIFLLGLCSVYTNPAFEDTDENGYSYADDRNNDEIRHTYVQPQPHPQQRMYVKLSYACYNVFVSLQRINNQANNHHY